MPSESSALTQVTRTACKCHDEVRDSVSVFLDQLQGHETHYQAVARAVVDASLREKDPAVRNQLHTARTLIDGANTRLHELRRAAMELGQIMHDVDALADRLAEIETEAAEQAKTS